jgi:hypothetical protein
MSDEVTRSPPRRHASRRITGVALVGMTLVAMASSSALEAIGNDSTASFAPALSVLPFVAVSALVVLRRPESTVGLLLSVVTFLLTTGCLAERLKVSAEGRLLGTFAAWYGAWYWVPMSSSCWWSYR